MGKMKRFKRVLGLMLCAVMIFGTIGANAALPTQTENGIALPNFNRNIYNITKGNGGDGGTYTTTFDDEMGKIHRWTTNKGSSTYNRFAISLYFADDKSGNPGIKAGDKFYISYYYRLNTPETDGKVTAAANGMQMAKFLHDYTDKGTVNIASAEDADGSWRRYEGIIPMNYDRTWWESALHFNMGVSANSVASVDFAGIKAIHLGAATDEEDGTTVLQQIQNTFSTNSKIKSIKIGNTEIDLNENPYSCSVVGSVESVSKNVTVVPESSDATVKITTPDESTCLITVYSARADLLNPSAGQYTVYAIECNRPEVIIGANDGRGIRGTTDGTYQVEGEADREIVNDGIFGNVYRYGAVYTEKAKWPKFNLNFPIEKTAVNKADYVYFSFYYRVNTAETDSRVTAQPTYICRSSEVSGLKNTKNLDISKPGEWQRAEYIIPYGADTETVGIPVRFQYGAKNFGDYVSFDFAAAECYLLGNVTYFDGATEEDFSNAVAEKLKSTFTSAKTFNELSVYGVKADLSREAWSFVGSPEKVIAGLKYTTTEDGAYVAVKKQDAKTVAIRVYSHLADIPNAKPCEYKDYTITNDVLINGYKLSYEGSEVTDFSQFAAGSYTVEFNVAKDAETAFAANVFAGAYDEGGALIGVGSASISDGTAAVSAQINVNSAPSYFKVFVFDGLMPHMSTTLINGSGIRE